MNTYILQKDTPNCKAGDEFTWVENNYLYFKNGSMGQPFFEAKAVQNNPEWFKPKEERPLFTTEDGVNIFCNDTKIWVVDNSFQLWSANAISRSCDADKKYFYSQSAAEQYILEEKPCLCLSDLHLIFEWSDKEKFKAGIVYEKTLALVKEKLKA